MHERRCVRAVARALLPAPALLHSPSPTSDLIKLPGPVTYLEHQQRRAPRLVAETKDRSGQQTHERRYVRVVRRLLLSAAALRPPCPTPSSSPRPRTPTATSAKARRAHGGRRRAAEHERRRRRTVAHASALRLRPPCLRRASGLVAVDVRGRRVGRRGRWAQRARGRGQEQVAEHEGP